MRPNWIGGGFLRLTQRSARLRPILWRWLYNQLASRDRSGHLLFMNYGYAEENESLALKLQPQDEPFRYPIQLYAHVVSAIDLRGKDVLEVGCGRGGGGAFLVRYREPRLFTGVDISEPAIEWCQQHLPFPNARWLQGRADALPVPDASIDVVVNVEASHCYPSMAGSLSEVTRALRPGGYFAFCDMRRPEGVATLDRSFDESGLKQLEHRVITPQVLRALDRVSPEKELRIASRVPRLFRPAFRGFFAVKSTPLYNMLATGQMTYLSYLLQKPE